jgi:excisionase family DNA binding protein
VGKLLTVKQVAEQIGVSEGLVYSLVASGELAHLRLGGRQCRG